MQEVPGIFTNSEVTNVIPILLEVSYLFLLEGQLPDTNTPWQGQASQVRNYLLLGTEVLGEFYIYILKGTPTW